MDGFSNAAGLLADLDSETVSRVIGSATDVALIVEDGVVKDVAVGSEELEREGYPRTWLERPWIDTVTLESRPKIESLLREATTPDGRWRQVNHPATAGADVPIRYTAVGVRDHPERVVALGRDLRANADIQQRLVEAHQRLERDYARLRDAEARYRLLFDAVSDAVLIVEPDALIVQEANLAAARALATSPDQLAGRELPTLFDAESRPAVGRLVAAAASTGEARHGPVSTPVGRIERLAASAFRESTGIRVILRLEGNGDGGGEGVGEGGGGLDRTQLTSLVDSLPDGLVVAGADQRVLMVNRSLAEMVQVIDPGRMVGSPLAEFLGRSATETNVLVSNLRNHGVVRNFATVLRDRFGHEEEVEVSAVSAPGGTAGLYGLAVRSVARRLTGGLRVQEGLPTSARHLAGLVGRVPLREIVREATDFIERLCIEAALEITDDNRASAAEMLGLSRQSLYSKLKRFGLEESR